MMYAMARIFKAEMNRLRREESGVALMLTLSVVLLLYVLCAGVYAVGETARQKIEIQNACDAAAYSAALVEADGLSRMAMVNRALAWTYIMLTNMQIDYLTYKWLELVERRFSADQDMCEKWAESSEYKKRGIGKPACPECDALEQQDGGWFCGVAGAGTDYIRLNGSQTPVPISAIRDTLKEFQAIDETYAQYIPQFKQNIDKLNGSLWDVAKKMNDAIKQTAMVVLKENLPRLPSGRPDGALAEDFLGYCQSPTFFSPYVKVEVDDTVVGNMMSPLYNTELDERLFLTMADGEVYDNLADYFGPSGDEDKRFGGLDQWFVRSHEAETRADAPVVERTADSYKALGICRVYKNANRMGDGQLSAYRAHHWRLGEDSRPSCINTRLYCPDQCWEAPGTVAPYAEYEWCSGKYTYSCYRFYVSKPHVDIHIHKFKSEFLENCTDATHLCTNCSPSHARSQYGSCLSREKKLRLIDPVSGKELKFPPWPPGRPLSDSYSGDIDPYWMTSRGIVQLSVTSKPNGFARIYGDDREICNRDTFEYYTGQVAMPWILNDKYYSHGGSVVVGLARRQRNPWAALFNGLSADSVPSSEKAEGIYSAFDPVADGYLVAFSAARAAHRFNPSRWGADVPQTSRGEYETRYDAVCDDALDESGTLGRFNIRQDDAELLENRIGCVCKDRVNQQRFARCWNLCETDWDAMLLPLKYSQMGLSSPLWYDSLSGPFDVTWADDSALNESGRNPFYSAANGKWFSLVTETEDGISGAFLSLAAPPRPGEKSVKVPSAMDVFSSPAQPDVSEDDSPDTAVPGSGRLDLNTLIRTRIL